MQRRELLDLTCDKQPVLLAKYCSCQAPSPSTGGERVLSVLVDCIVTFTPGRASRCSEPLTLEEEIANQRSWYEDERKITFIVCACPARSEASLEATCEDPQSSRFDRGSANDLTLNMVGDVNAFFSEIIADPINDDDEGQPTGEFSAELEVMIAERSHRRKGLAREALLLLVYFILKRVQLPIREFVAKISDGNDASMRLFTMKLGFKTRRRLEIFSQTELVLDANTARELATRAWDEVQGYEFHLNLATPDAVT